MAIGRRVAWSWGGGAEARKAGLGARVGVSAAGTAAAGAGKKKKDSGGGRKKRAQCKASGQAVPKRRKMLLSSPVCSRFSLVRIGCARFGSLSFRFVRRLVVRILIVCTFRLECSKGLGGGGGTRPL